MPAGGSGFPAVEERCVDGRTEMSMVASGEFALLRTRQRPDSIVSGGGQVQVMTSRHKKSRTLPVRVRVGPTKNLLQRRTEKRPARHKDTKVPCWYFNLWSKRAILILGRFTRTFAEISDGMSSESAADSTGTPFQLLIYPLSGKKSSPFPLFSKNL